MALGNKPTAEDWKKPYCQRQSYSVSRGLPTLYLFLTYFIIFLLSPVQLFSDPMRLFMEYV